MADTNNTNKAWNRTIFPDTDTSTSNGTSNNPLEVVQGSSTSTFYTGVDNVFKMGLDPLVTGYAFIYWVDLPPWFDDDYELKFFRDISHRNFQSFSGLGDITLNTSQVTTGFGGREYSIANGIQVGNTEFSITHNEYTGAVMTKMYDKWITMIRDKRTNVSLYPHAYKDDNGNPKYEYATRNHTGKLLYIMVRPDINGKNAVENAFYYVNVLPTNVPLDTFNFHKGQQETPSVTISFNGFLESGPDVVKMAKSLLDKKILYNADNPSGIRIVDSYDTFNDNDTSKPYASMMSVSEDGNDAGSGNIK